MSWKKVKLKQILKQYRIEHLVQNDIEYKQVTISKYDGVTFRGTKMGKEIGRKRQFQIDLKKYPNTLMFVRQGVQDGSIGIAPLEVDGCIATENMPMFSIEGINLEYLKFLLKSPYFYDELNKIQTTGSAQKSIHEREILEIEIPFPDIEEQAEIVKELSRKKDNSIEISTELTHQLTLVKKLRQQLLQDAVQGKLVERNLKDEPASELFKKIKAEKQKLIAEKTLKKEKELPPIKPEEIPFEIPENWVWCRLGDLCTELLGGYAFDSTRYSKIETSNQVIRLGNVKPNQLVLETTPVYIDDVYADEAIRAKLFEGDILITMTGTRAKRDYLFTLCLTQSDLETKTLFLNQRVGCFRFGSFVANSYINIILKDLRLLQAVFDSSTGAANQANIGIAALKDILTPLPPFAEQNRIVQKLDELMQYCNELEASIKQSELQNSTLLQQVLREALKVSEPQMDLIK